MIAFLNDADVWHWLEHLSWAVAVFGFPLAAYAAWDQMRKVRAEQERIFQELGSRANVFVGFRPVAAQHKSIQGIHHAGHARNIPEMPQETQIRAHFGEAASKSDPLELGIFTYNHGPRTAHNLLWNILVPFGIDCAHVKHSDLEYSRDPDGCTRIIRRAENLHPEVVFREGIKMKLPPGMDEFDISVTLSLEDVPTKKLKLKVRVGEFGGPGQDGISRTSAVAHDLQHRDVQEPAGEPAAVAPVEPVVVPAGDASV